MVKPGMELYAHAPAMSFRVGYARVFVYVASRNLLKIKELNFMLRRILPKVVNFLKQEDGPTAVEYAVMLALIIVVCIGTITTLGGNANNTFNSVGGAVNVTGS
jgi:pilus assembly protein Flp/PilA